MKTGIRLLAALLALPAAGAVPNDCSSPRILRKAWGSCTRSACDRNPALMSDPTLARWGKALKEGGQGRLRREE